MPKKTAAMKAAVITLFNNDSVYRKISNVLSECQNLIAIDKLPETAASTVEPNRLAKSS